MNTFRSYLVEMTWEQAQSRLVNCPYLGQRKVSDARLEGLQAIYDAGRWRPFAISLHHLLGAPDREFLTNGQHRLTIAVRNKATLPFIVEHHGVASMQDIKEAYEGYDTPESARDFRDLVPSSGLLEMSDLTVTKLQYLKPAVDLINADWESPRLRSVQRAARSNQLRFGQMVPWLEEGSRFFGAARPIARSVDLIFRMRALLSVGLVIMRHQEERAAEFVQRLASNSGLSKSEPEWELIQRFSQRNFAGKGDPCHEARLVAAAWNAFYDGRSLGVLKGHPECPIIIKGTPYKG